MKISLRKYEWVFLVYLSIIVAAIETVYLADTMRSGWIYNTLPYMDDKSFVLYPLGLLALLAFSFFIPPFDWVGLLRKFGFSCIGMAFFAIANFAENLLYSDGMLIFDEYGLILGSLFDAFLLYLAHLLFLFMFAGFFILIHWLVSRVIPAACSGEKEDHERHS